MLAVHKPAGLLVHPSWIAPAKTPNLVALLRERYPGEKLHTVHRLDRATSGVILFARNKTAGQHLQQQFIERKINKTYLCVVRGWTDEAGTIDYALKPIHDKKADHPNANPDKEPKEAVSAYRRIATARLPIPVGRYPEARYSLVEVKPSTGRKHQIRRHMKHILHPIVGDTKYGEGRHNRLFREHLDSHRLLLMATAIEFEHPESGQMLRIEAGVGEDIKCLFEKLNWQEGYPVAHRVETRPKS
ncbi:tRNA pseudouridine(65) synthase TruC [Marinobacterium sp. AK62]|uniref:tRNA pseudouridine synthase C n=1 Tax=Marinobacterium alkalitolerans TaxID=1542925 RepID=A0ABS3ZC53_9GAMM|nr:pseudouridine synthase [Marinobacterium alkalitolerans]MBP0049201.1 tRNA pseudouridine(65) synthase TruC [Marinobacterium alkalitolerans]